MDKTILLNEVNNGFSSHKIAQRLMVSQATVKYWLKKHGLKTQWKVNNRYVGKKVFLCLCGENKKENFMISKNKTRSHTLCKKCHNKNTIKRGRLNRKTYVDYKGGKCEKCGYNKCIEALDFHHRDKNGKDLKFKTIRYWGIEKAKKELDKCVLLCCRCHREEHYGIE